MLVLCALFFLLAMGLTLLSSGVYRAVAAQADETYAQRTALSYLVNQVRRSDAPGGVSVGRFGDSDALFLREEGYVTILYCYEGQLRELYMEDGLELSPADGVDVLPLERLELACGGASRHVVSPLRGGTGGGGMRRTHLFLTELVLDLFLFAVCAAVCAGLLLRARGMSRESRRLTEAVYAAQTIAEQWRATGVQPAWPAQDGSGLTGVLTVSGDALDIAVYADGALVYTLEGVRCLG